MIHNNNNKGGGELLYILMPNVLVDVQDCLPSCSSLDARTDIDAYSASLSCSLLRWFSPR